VAFPAFDDKPARTCLVLADFQQFLWV